MPKLFKLFTLFCVFCASTSSIHAENYMKYILARYIENGTLFFVKPTKANIKEGEIKKALEFDITYISPKDTITLNASVQLAQPQKLDTLVCQSATGEVYSFETQRLYLQPRGSHWESRLSIAIPYAQWQKLLQAQQPSIFSFNNNHKTIVSYQFTPKQWHRQQGIFQILDQIRRN